MKYKYFKPEYEDENSLHEFESDALNPDYVVKDAARHYHDRSHDSMWPIIFVIFDANGTNPLEYEVDRVPEPVFELVTKAKPYILESETVK